MEPVHRSKSRILLALLAIVLLLSTVVFYNWHQLVNNPAPISVKDLDTNLLETSRAEVSQEQNPLGSKLNEAQAALRSRQPEAALIILEKLAKDDQHNPVVYVAYGQALKLTGELDRAEAAFSHAIKLKPDMAEPYLYRGHIHKAAKRYEQAMADYNQALKCDSELAVAYYHRGDVFLLQEEYDQALASFSEAIEQPTADKRTLTAALLKRGYILYLQKEHQAAVRDLSRAIELAPNMYEAYLYRANALSALRRYDMAVRDYNELIRLKPNFALGYFGRALALQEIGEAKRAEKDFQKAEQMGIKRMGRD